MTVKLIKIRNVLGVSDIEFEPGKVTEISGRNATGKTSILNAIRSVVKASNDATLLRAGEEQGEVVLVLDNDTEIGRKFTEARTYPFARQGKMNASSPVSFIAGLVGAYALNPIEFIYADDKRRIEYLLSCINVQLDFEELEKISGLSVPDVPAGSSMGALELIDQLRKELYDKRTGLNRAVKESQAVIARMEKSLPEQVRSADELKAERNEVAKEVNTVMKAAKDSIANVDSGCKAKTDEIDAEIEKLKQAIDDMQQSKGFLREQLARDTTRIKAKASEDSAGLRERLVRLESQIEEAGRVENTLSIIGENKADVTKLEKQTKDVTKRIVKLDEYKAQQLAALPVNELSVIDGKLMVGELPFENINTAEKVRIAFELARLQAGELGLVCVDGLELLDREHYDELIERAKNSDVQLIITAVTNDDLTIKT